MKKRVIVTGGAGFIGTHLIKRLLADGHAVTVIERYSLEKKKRLEELFGSKAISVIWRDVSQGDVRREKWEVGTGNEKWDILKSRTSSHHTSISHITRLTSHFQGADWVFHLVGIPNNFDTDPRLFHTAHVTATVSVLEAARRAGVSRFLYPGSTTCYGHADIFPTPETTPIRLLYPYALTKYIGEQYVLHWGNVYKLPVVVLRPFSVYGPRFPPTASWGAITPFMRQKRRGEPFQVRGDGNQSRDFVYIDDVIDAFVRAAESNVSNEVFNVGTGMGTSINTLVSLLGGPVRYIPKEHEEIPYMCADNRKIRTILGWKPRISLEKGIQAVLKKEL